MTTSNSAKKGSSHSEYLLMLQERNRIMKKLQNKNNEQKLLEQREQGFSLYLNGANASLQLPVRRHSRKATNRNTKTAGSDRLVGDHDNNDTQSRAKTAPMKERLKWGHHSYEVTTSDGDVVHVPAPDAKFTGNYEEDFEATTLDNTVQLDLSSDNTKVLKNALKEIMGGDGDMSSDNCSDDSIGHSDNEEVCHENMASFPTMQASVTKTTRSLSAVKKKSMTTTTDAGVSHDVIVALQAENDAISHTHNLAQQPHLPHDANCIHIPLHPPATPSTENTIAIVTEQVKQMNCRQQKKLLRWLDRLERLPSPPPSAVTPSDFSTAKLHSCSINSNPQPDLHSTIRVLSCSTDNDSHSCSTDTDLHSIANTKPLVARKRSPYSAKEHRRSSFDWLNSDNVKIQRSQSVGKLSNVIGVDEDVLIPRLPSGRTSGLRGLLSGGRHQLEDDPQLQTKSESHLPTFLDEQPLPTHVAMARGSTAVITSLHDNLDLPSAEDTDVTDQYHMTGSCDPVSDITTKSHDMDTLLASLSIFDTTHLGRLGTAVSMEMSSSNYGDSLDISVDTVEPEQQSQSSVIPILPRGRHVIFNIRSTWGDHHYVGLNGIELFTELGTPATVQSITAEPADINTLPGYHSDPRVVTNLLDGVNMTRDDFHMWLTPFTPGRDHVIHITLDDVTTIAMIRIWNYNKSRIHSCRGVRHIIVTLDNQVVFNGEVARASGELTGSIDNYGDTILFTVDDDVLMKIANHDQVFQQEQMGGADVEEEDNSRPSTGGVSEVLCDPVEITMEMANQITSPLLANELQLQLLNTWGDPHYIGLTGLAVLGVGLEPLPLAAEQLAASPCDLNDLPEYTDDDRTLDKLVDGVNVTTCDSHMWLAPYTPGGDHVITITLATPALVAGIQVWNYNKSTEDTSRGVKEVIISIDGHVISDGCNWLFRRAPGNEDYNFAQLIIFDINQQVNIILDNTITLPLNISTITMPTGFVYQLQLLTTWGDPYYVGLNGLEVYSEDGSQLVLTNNNIAAHPHSVNILDAVVRDIRTPDKLIDGCYDTIEGDHMWLAPILPGIVNKIYIIFDTPVTLSALKLWNYAKTPSRGVRELSVLIDDLIIHNGEMSMADTRPCLPSLTPSITPHVIFFTDHMNKLNCNQQEVQLTNDSHVIHSHTHHPQHSQLVADQALRPITSLTASTSSRKHYSNSKR